MGGFGSGRWEYATTPTVGECRHLSANAFTDVVENPGYSGQIYWGGTDDPDASVSMVLLSDDHLTALKEGKTLETTPAKDCPDGVNADERATAVYLQYTITDTRTEESREVSYCVPLEYTDCNFGGVRPWFRCPVDAGGCDRRVGKLCLPPSRDRYLCRECYDLGYQSSRTSGDDMKQAELRYRRAFAKADAEDRRPHPNGHPPLPDKPKGMHRETFDDLLDNVRDARDEWHQQMDEKMKELLARYETEAGRAATAVTDTSS